MAYIIDTPVNFLNSGTSTVFFTDTTDSIQWQIATEVPNDLEIGTVSVPNVLQLTPTGVAADALGLRANGNAVTLKADPALSASYNYFFPATPPTAVGQYMVFNGTTNVFTNINANNELAVSKTPGPGQFSSLAAAIASIPVTPAPGSPADGNRFVILVYPGDYLEPAIVLPSFVFVVGQDMRACRFGPSALGYTLFTINVNSGLAFHSIMNTDPAFPAVVFHNSGDYTLFHKIDMTGCSACMSVTTDSSATGTSLVYLEYVSTTDALTYSLNAVDTNALGGFGSEVSIENFFSFGHNASALIVNGANSSILSQATVLQGDGTGNAVLVQNGGEADLRGTWIAGTTSTSGGWTNGILVPNDSGTPMVLATGILFENCTVNINIENVQCKGHNDGFTEYTKTLVPKASPFFIANTNQQIITVALKGGDFSSVAAALAAITDNSSTIGYTIEIGPGVYFEPPLTGKPYVNILGTGCTIFCTTPSAIAYTGVDGQSITGLTITGLGGSGSVIVYYQGAGTAVTPNFFISQCVIGNAETGIWVHGNGATTICGLVQVEFLGSNFHNTTNIKVSNDNISTTQVLATTVFVEDFTGPYAPVVWDISGTNVSTTLLASVVQQNNNVVGGSTAFKVYGGAAFTMLSTTVSGVYNGIWNPLLPSGPGCNINTSGVVYSNCRYEIRIENPATVGVANGDPDITTQFVNSQSSFALDGFDPNAITISKKGLNIHTIAQAIQYINPTLAVATASGQTNITSAGLFNIQMDGAMISTTTPGIFSPGTSVTFVDDVNMTLSSPALATAPVSALFTIANAANRYVLNISPGTYVENNPLTVPSYVSLLGSSNVFIEAANIGQTILNVGSQVSVSSLTVIGQPLPASPTGVVGLSVVGSIGVYFQSLTVAFCDVAIYESGATGPAQMVINGLSLNDIATYGIHVDGTVSTSGTNPVEISTGTSIVHQDVTYDSFSPSICRFEGPNAIVVQANTTISSSPTSIGISISDGASAQLATMGVNGSQTGLYVDAIGAGPNIEVNDILINDSGTFNVNILNPGTTGVLQGIFTRAKTFINPLSTISVQYLDPVENGTVLIGELYLGNNNQVVADMRPSIDNVNLVAGVASGGVLTPATSGPPYPPSSPVVINVAQGTGYLEFSSSPHVVKYYTWNATSISIALPSVTTVYFIYFDVNGVLQAQTAFPNPEQSILLGRVIINTSGLEILDAIPVSTDQVSNRYDQFHRNAIGAVVAFGIMVTGYTPSLQLSVSSGQYYYSGDVFNPSGSAQPLTFSTYYTSSTTPTFVIATGVTVVDTSNYNPLSGPGPYTLTPIPAGQFVLHSIYMVGQAPNEQYMFVYGQSVYATQSDAAAGVYPTPPFYFDDGIILLAGLVVQQGSTAILQVIDRRPVITTNATSLAASINVNLNAYLLRNGTMPMTGNLDLGTNNIINVGTIDGITLQTISTRLVPNSGLDPLPTAAPTIDLNANTTNSVGTANSFSRSDHTHAIDTATAVSIGSSNQPGTGAPLIRADHVHQGVHSISANAPSAQDYNDVSLNSTSSITVTDTGPSGGYSNIAFSLVAPVSVANGGTSSTTPLNNNRIVVSSGGAIVEAAALGNGQLLIGSVGAAPVVGNIIAGSNISIANGPGSISISTINSGTVSSVGLAMPSDFTVTGSPVTSSGTLTVTANTQADNTFYSGPASGPAAAPTFRTMVAADMSSVLTADGQVLIGSSSGSPVATTLTAGSNVSIANASGSITISTINSGTVTQINTGTGLTGGPITSSGTISLSVPVVAINGGTGQTVYTVGDLLYADTMTSLARLADIATGNVLLSGGAGVAPGYGKVSLTGAVSGVLGVANGGTNSGTALVNNQLMASSGGAIVEAGALTNGQLFIGNTGNTPTAATLTAGSGVTIVNGAGTITVNATGTGGTVTSVGLSMPSIFTVTNSPVTNSGTLTVTSNTQAANLIYSGPPSGSVGVPTFRSLVVADLPTNIPNANLQNSSLTVSAGTGLSGGGLVSLGGSTTLSLTIPVVIADGGTNSTAALVNNRLMVSSGGAIVEATALTDGQLFIGSTGSTPVATTLTAGTGVSIANASGSITISSSPTTSPQYLTITPSQISVSNGAAATVAYVPWQDSRLGSYTTRTITSWIVPSASASNDLIISVLQNGGTTLGSIVVSGGSAVGAIYSFTFTNPGIDTRLDLQVERTGVSGNNPVVFGINMGLA